MSNFTTLVVKPAHQVTLDTSGATTYDAIYVLGGDLTISGSGVDVVTPDFLSVRGIVNVDGGATLDITGGAVNRATFFTIGTGSTLIEGGSEFNTLSPVDFTGSSGKLELNTEGGFAPRILSPVLNFQAGDTIEVNSAINGTSYDPMTGLLTLTENGATVGTLTVVGEGLSAGFHITPDGSSGFDITVACFLPQTRVLTDRGEVASGDVAIGDRLVTVSGEAKPVKWIGRRSYSASMAASAPNVAPVLVREGALAEGLPTRDLYLSPCHALFLDGVLIEAGHLVNDVSILRVPVEDRVDYVNFEFETHEIIVVEGVPAETGAGRDNRAIYDNGADYASLYPLESTSRVIPYCAPRLDCGFQVEAVRAMIDARAGIAGLTDATSAPLKGWINRIDGHSIRGVAYCEGGSAPVVLEVVVDGIVLGEAIANHQRSLFVRGERHEGRCGFEVALPQEMSPFERHVVSVRRASDKTELAGSPFAMEAATRLDEAGRLRLGTALEGAASHGASVAELDRAIAVLAAKADELLQAKADLAGHRAERAGLRPRPGRSDLRAPQDVAAGMGERQAA